MEIDHGYRVHVTWQGPRGTEANGYRDYSRTHEVTGTAHGVEKAQVIRGSSDKAFRGDPALWNPEELLLSALSQCHMLSYLYCAVQVGVVVESYTDEASGTMRQVGEGGAFTEAVLRPIVTISAGDPAAAEEAHHRAHELCFIASSVNFPVRVEPTIRVA